MAANRHYIQLKSRDWVERQYAKYSTHEIARQLGCDQRLVWNAIHLFGIQPRRQGRPDAIRPKGRYRKSKSNGRAMSRARAMMERHLGRRLDTKEHVHHIDGNKLNDTLDNLMVLSESEHHRLHGQDAKMWAAKRNYLCYDKACIQCGYRFTGNNVAKYCPNCRPRRYPK